MPTGAKPGHSPGNESRVLGFPAPAPPAAIEARELTRRFGSLTAVDGASFHVPAGRIAGFLGPNGAGKSTTMKLLAGLMAPDGGSVTIGGLDPRRDRTSVLSSTGSLIEAPGFFTHLTALENLLWLGSVGRPESPAALRPRAESRLASLGMAEAASRKVGGFSTGMKMRLALALAVLHEPALLLLDEPTSGLDPAGRKIVRDLLLQLNRSAGTTVFISSHLLEEIEVVCDWLVVIDSGKIRAQGPLADLLPASGLSRFTARVDPVAAARDLLAASSGVTRVEQGEGEVSFHAPRESIPDLVRALVKKEIRLFELRDLGRSVEAFYMDATRKADTR